jgi:predicted nucleotidyltransferase
VLGTDTLLKPNDSVNLKMLAFLSLVNFWERFTMTEHNLLITSLQTSAKQCEDAVGPFKLYLFGSALKGQTPKDIDLLIIFDVSKISFEVAISLKNLLFEKLMVELNIPVDICLLSSDEVIGNPFIQDEGARLIFG